MKPGQKVFYTKDNVKYFGYIVKINNTTNKNVVCIAGSDAILELSDDELEEDEEDHRSYIEFVELNELPEVGEKGVIYLIPAETPSEDHLFDEYVYLEGKDTPWEKLDAPQIEIDLSPYYTKEQIDESLGDINDNIISLIDSLQDDTDDITTLKNRVSTTESDISNLENTVSSILPAVGDNTLNISSLQSDVTSLETDMSLVKTSWTNTLPIDTIFIKSINATVRDSDGNTLCAMSQRVRNGIVNPMTTFYFDSSTQSVVFVRTNFSAAYRVWSTVYKKLSLSGSSIIYGDFPSNGFTIEINYEVIS